MRKLSGIFAGTLALTLVFGMTAFAAPSKSTSNQDNTSTTKELTAEELAKKGYTAEQLQKDGVDSKKADIVDTVSKEAAAAKMNASATSNSQTTSDTVEFDEKAENDALSASDKAAAEQKAKSLNNVNAANSTATLANGLVVKPTINNVSPAVANKADEIAWKLAESASGSDKDAKEVAVKGAAEVSLEGVSAEALAKGVSITLDFGFTPQAGKTYSLLHLVNGQWITEKITAISSNGQITATIYSLSPLVAAEYVLVEAEDDDNDDSAAASGSSSSTLTSKGKVASPKTGEAVPFAGVVAAVALAGAAVAAKKVRYNG